MIILFLCLKTLSGSHCFLDRYHCFETLFRPLTVLKLPASAAGCPACQNLFFFPVVYSHLFIKRLLFSLLLSTKSVLATVFIHLTIATYICVLTRKMDIYVQCPGLSSKSRCICLLSETSSYFLPELRERVECLESTCLNCVRWSYF